MKQGRMTVRIAIAAIVACLCPLVLTVSDAFAVDWTVNSTISEAVELNSNQFLRTMRDYYILSVNIRQGSLSYRRSVALCRTGEERILAPRGALRVRMCLV